MPKITSIKGARGYGRRKKIVPYLATVTTQTVPGAYARDYSYVTNAQINFANSDAAANGYILVNDSPYGPGARNAYYAVQQTTYSCPLGGTYNATTGLCS